MNLIEKIFNVSSRARKKYAVPENSENDYFLLECWKQYANLPAEVLPHVDIIKTRAEWENSGFTFEFNRYGQVRKIKAGNKYFSFIKVDPEEKLVAAAIESGLRITQNAEHIDLLLEQGCQTREFLFLQNTIAS